MRMDSLNSFMITSWNVEGLCGVLRKRIIWKWVIEQRSIPPILCLQEIKVEGFRLDLALQMILSDHRAIILLSMQGNGGTMILVHPNIVVENSRGLMQGQVTWVIVT